MFIYNDGEFTVCIAKRQFAANEVQECIGVWCACVCVVVCGGCVMWRVCVCGVCVVVCVCVMWRVCVWCVCVVVCV